MRILCCYDNNRLSLTALKSFGEHAPEVEMVNITGDWSSRESMMASQTRLWTVMRSHWTGEEDFIMLSQDQVITADTIPDMLKCESKLCRKDGAKLYTAELQQQITADTIAGEYCVWHILEERLLKLWVMHQIGICLH
jgi:hypothetical protein